MKCLTGFMRKECERRKSSEIGITDSCNDLGAMVYPGKVVRGYHCPPVQQPYWNTMYLGDFPDDELLNMIDLAYETVFNSFSKKVQKQIMEEA